MLEFLLNIIKENPLAYGVISFLSGAITGHWLALDRDKRKEFNDAAIPIRKAIFSQLDAIKNDTFIPNTPSREQLIGFKVFLSGGSIERYCQAVDEYSKCFKHDSYLVPQNKGGSKIFTTVEDLKALEISALKILKYCKIK